MNLAPLIFGFIVNIPLSYIMFFITKNDAYSSMVLGMSAVLVVCLLFHSTK